MRKKIGVSMNSGSKEKTVVALIACRDKNGLVRLPTDGDKITPGLHIQDGSDREEQELAKAVAEKMHRQDLVAFIKVDHVIHDALQLASGKHCDLVVGEVDSQKFTAPLEWATVPSLIREMPANRNRLAYLKAWQILTGAHQESLEAVEITEDMRRRLKESFKNDPN